MSLSCSVLRVQSLQLGSPSYLILIIHAFTQRRASYLRRHASRRACVFNFFFLLHIFFFFSLLFFSIHTSTLSVSLISSCETRYSPLLSFCLFFKGLIFFAFGCPKPYLIHSKQSLWTRSCFLWPSLNSLVSFFEPS